MYLLVPKQISRYNLYEPPAPRINPGGGMGVKYARVVEAARPLWSAKRIHSLDGMPRTDFLLVDPLWFEWQAKRGDESFRERVKAVEDFDAKYKVWYGSELSFMSWNANQINLVMKVFDMATHNCGYLKQMQTYFNHEMLNESMLLCDPTPEYLFYPARKENRIIAMSQISWIKQTSEVVKIFKGLKDSPIETIYVGSANLWSDSEAEDQVLNRFQLECDIRSSSDIFKRNLDQQGTSYHVNTSKHFVHTSYHDTSCQSQQENALAGTILWGLTHPLNKERGAFCFENPEDLTEALLAYSNVSHDEYMEDSNRTRQYGLDNFSYAAWKKQMRSIENCLN